MKHFVFWQQYLSPHALPLARALQARGHRVRVVVHEELAPERRALGWTSPDLSEVETVMLDKRASRETISALIDKSAVHLLQGLPRRGVLRRVQQVLASKKVLFGSMMEQVDDRGFRGWLKRGEYGYRLNNSIAPLFVLAIGARAAPWFSTRAKARQDVYAFSYFLEPPPPMPKLKAKGTPKIAFVGQMIPRKRLDLLIRALSHKEIGHEFSLVCIGGGKEASMLKKLAQERLGAPQVDWLGALPLDQVRQRLPEFHRLVLPCDFDGWGAVVSEALTAGVQVICSDACGASTVVQDSRQGYVFQSGDELGLSLALQESLQQGPASEAQRRSLASWAECLTAPAGALYLENIVAHLRSPSSPAPLPPWKEGSHS